LKIPQQALIDVSSAYNPALSYGAQGILGLGFTSLSTVDFLVNKTGNSTGRSVLFNAFATNPNEPNFIAFALSNGTRSGNEDEYEGSFAIGEYEDDFKSVAQTNEIPTWPVNAPSRWNVLLEALIVGQTIVPVTTNVTGAPSNRAVALLDSGTSFT
jgi:saccharopepsin